MSAWGDAWAQAWGDSWGAVTPTPPTPVARHPVWGMRIQPDRDESFIMDDMEAAAVGVALLMLGDKQ